jgi:hypothetical protein
MVETPEKMDDIAQRAKRIAEETLPCMCEADPIRITGWHCCHKIMRPAVESAVSKLLVENEKLREKLEKMADLAIKELCWMCATGLPVLDISRIGPSHWINNETRWNSCEASDFRAAIERSSRP